MQGRDTGTAAYQRAADYVATRFRQAGLRPAGENGTFFQTVPMHQVDVEPKGTSFTVVRSDGTRLSLDFLQEITLTPSVNTPQGVHGALTFRGYCGQDAMRDIEGKVVVCFGTQREGLPSGGERSANARAGKAAAVVTVDDPYFTIEPPRWPYAYARSVTLRPAATVPSTQPSTTARQTPQNTAGAPQPVNLRLSAAAFTRLLEGTGKDAVAILKAGGSKHPLDTFDLPAQVEVTLRTTQKYISSPNVLAVLPGSDPELSKEYVVVAAHLDGYGFGTPVLGDSLYNGALDDAAYVATLIQMADDLHSSRQMKGVVQGDVTVDPRRGVWMAAPRRSILFCAFTGEEKGLLGSTWFVQHPTVPLEHLAADINLDQLRPLFPLKILTALAIHDTTLGAMATAVGKQNGIELREDREPERGLLRRADHFPFLKAGVPAIGFIFGFDPGTNEEQRYRHWYQVQYHRPQDDLTQPLNFPAALTFNTFFYRFVEAVANSPDRPHILRAQP